MDAKMNLLIHLLSLLSYIVELLLMPKIVISSKVKLEFGNLVAT